MSLPSRANDEADRGEHRRLAETVERGVEERAEHGALARRPGERAVEDVGDRADDEEDAAEPEEELRVALLEADEHGADEAERDAAIVSMSGVSFVFATPCIERCRICRAACVYSCLTRSSSLTRGPCAGGSRHAVAWLAPAPEHAAGGRARAR